MTALLVVLALAAAAVLGFAAFWPEVPMAKTVDFYAYRFQPGERARLTFGRYQGGPVNGAELRTALETRALPGSSYAGAFNVERIQGEALSVFGFGHIGGGGPVLVVTGRFLAAASAAQLLGGGPNLGAGDAQLILAQAEALNAWEGGPVSAALEVVGEAVKDGLDALGVPRPSLPSAATIGWALGGAAVLLGVLVWYRRNA